MILTMYSDYFPTGYQQQHKKPTPKEKDYAVQFCMYWIIIQVGIKRINVWKATGVVDKSVSYKISGINNCN